MKILIISLALLTILLAGLPVQAENPNCTEGTTCLENPLGPENLTMEQVYGRIIYGFMAGTGALALLMFVIGGFQWLTAAGNAEKVKKGRDTLMWAILGLVVIFSSYAILRAVFTTLQF